MTLICLPCQNYQTQLPNIVTALPNNYFNEFSLFSRPKLMMTRIIKVYECSDVAPPAVVFRDVVKSTPHPHPTTNASFPVRNIRFPLFHSSQSPLRLFQTIPNTVEPRFNEVGGDRPNLFVKWRVRYIEVLFHTFYCNFGRDIEIISFVISRTSLNRGSLNRGST